MFWKKKSPEEEYLDNQISSMKSKKIEESLSAVSSIVEKGSGSPKIIKNFLIPRLPKLLKDGNIRIRTRTAFVLSGLFFRSEKLRDDLIKHLFDLLRHNDNSMRLYAANILGRAAFVTPELLKPLIHPITNLLKDRDQTLANNAAFAIGDIGLRAPSLIEDVIPVMNELLIARQNTVFTAFNLISQGSPVLIKDSVPRLLDIIKTTEKNSFDAGLQASILLIRVSHASRKLAEDLILPNVESLLGLWDKYARACAVYLVGGVGISRPELVEKLLPKLIERTKDRDGIVRAYAALSLGRICYLSPETSDTIVPILLKMVDDNEEFVRGAAAICLRYGVVSSPEQIKSVIPKLSNMLKDKNQIARGVASLGLRLISETVGGLGGFVIDKISDGVAEGNLRVRRGAAAAFQWISYLPDPEVDRNLLPEIFKFLEDKDTNVKLRTIQTVLNFSKLIENVEEWVPIILDLTKEKDVNLKINATITLGCVAENNSEVKDRVLPRLVDLLEDGNAAVRGAAALSLGRIM